MEFWSFVLAGVLAVLSFPYMAVWLARGRRAPWPFRVDRAYAVLCLTLLGVWFVLTFITALK